MVITLKSKSIQGIYTKYRIMDFIFREHMKVTLMEGKPNAHICRIEIKSFLRG